MKKHILILFIYILLANCSKLSYKKSDNTYINNKFTNDLIKKHKIEDKNLSLLFFTEFYENDSVTIYYDKKIIFRENLLTLKELGFAEVFKINNNEKIIIKFNNENQSFKLKTNKCKFIFIRKFKKNKNSRFEVIRKNSFKGFS